MSASDEILKAMQGEPRRHPVRRKPPTSVRLTPAEEAMLDGLSAELRLNHSQVIKKALRLLRAVQDAR